MSNKSTADIRLEQVMRSLVGHYRDDQVSEAYLSLGKRYPTREEWEAEINRLPAPRFRFVETRLVTDRGGDLYKEHPDDYNDRVQLVPPFSENSP